MDKAALSTLVHRLALENATKFKGRANPGAVMGGVLKEFPDARTHLGDVQQTVTEILEAINSLSPDEQQQELLKVRPNYRAEEQQKHKERQEQRTELPPLKNAELGKVITRIPPEPSKYNHIGHALSFLLNYMYAMKYDGSCILRFEDTNPEKETQEFVDAMERDCLEYLNIKPDTVLFASDHMPRFYECAESLIDRSLAYTCMCPSERISEDRREMKDCSCRAKPKDTVLAEWQRMLKGEYPEGSITLRLKISMQHKNAVMRDPVILRICLTPHYRQGDEYKVWPMYDFENALEDSWYGVTHIMRSNEFETRVELQEHIKELFGLPKQEVMQYGRFNIVGATTQGREIRELIDSGKMIGWDDPRLVTLRALKRRGIVREAFYELAKVCGMSKTQTNLSFDVLASINRRILDEEANRYFFIEDPVTIAVEGWPSDLTTVELKLHPHKHRGGRPFALDGTFVLAKQDHEEVLDGRVFRLIDTINLMYDAAHKRFVVHSRTIDEYRRVPKEQRHGLIHFLPGHEELVPARVFRSDATYAHGVCEPTVAQLRPGNTLQFERCFFARLDSIDENEDGSPLFTFWYAHE